MAAIKKEFLKLKTYKEYDVKRELFSELDWNDSEINNHYSNLIRENENHDLSAYFKDGIMMDFIEMYK